MSIIVAGVGYVGTTTAVLLAELGCQVTGVDVDPNKIAALKNGQLPFYEPGLDQLLRKHCEAGNIAFRTDLGAAVADHDIIFICVGTPSQADGSADLRYVREVLSEIGAAMDGYKLIVMKSTVPVGTHARAERWIQESQQHAYEFDVVSNPEFLREGSAVYDAFHPDRIVIGSKSQEAATRLQVLYASLECPVLTTTPATAEMIKYASNAFLATKISFMNELARLCDTLQVSITDVATGMGYDPRIGKAFLRAGIGYGGSCFPKDVRSLLHTAAEQGMSLKLLQQAVTVNQTQYHYALQRLRERLGSFHGKRIAVLGLSFKPETDDLREAPSLYMISILLAEGAIVQTHDPIAILPDDMGTDHLTQADRIEDALRDVDAVLLCTEWQMYIHADWERLLAVMNGSIILDGRNVLNREQLEILGYQYVGIGLGQYIIHRL